MRARHVYVSPGNACDICGRSDEEALREFKEWLDRAPTGRTFGACLDCLERTKAFLGERLFDRTKGGAP